jgi:uncharacterized iron-regulated membrane protein
MRTVHRYVAVFAVLFGLYVGCTGVLLQLIDLRTLLNHAPATDPNMQAIREGHDGPPNFRVIVEPDYAAAPLPADLDFDSALATVVKAEHAATGDAPISFVELRMMDGRPVGQVSSRGRLLRFDALTGEILISPDHAARITLPPTNTPSLRGTIKNIHRMNAYGDWATILEVIAGLTLCVMIITGVILYFRLLGSRVRAGRSNLFWFAGGWWRTLHRVIAAAAGAFLLVVALSGTLLGLGSLGVSTYRLIHHGNRAGLTVDASSPLADDELPGMLHTTLAAYGALSPSGLVKVIRLRYFAGMPQGVIVTGDEESRQLAFNAATGRRASLSGPGYPVTGQPFGWQEDQIVKQIHRGDFIGLSGRWISLFAGLSMLFLSISGAVMYFDLWRRRRRTGRRALFWR